MQENTLKIETYIMNDKAIDQKNSPFLCDQVASFEDIFINRGLYLLTNNIHSPKR